MSVSSDPYTLRQEAERVIGEDRVPAEELRRLVATFGHPEADAPDPTARGSTEAERPRHRHRFFTVRLAADGLGITRRDVLGEDADEAVANAVKASEEETGRRGWLLEGCEEEED